MVLATIYKVTTQDALEKAHNDTVSTWTFGGEESALEFAEKMFNEGDILWYSIEGLEIIPCDENDPTGRLYYGMVYSKYKDREDK